MARPNKKAEIETKVRAAVEAAVQANEPLTIQFIAIKSGVPERNIFYYKLQSIIHAAAAQANQNESPTSLTGRLRATNKRLHEENTLLRTQLASAIEYILAMTYRAKEAELDLQTFFLPVLDRNHSVVKSN